MKWRIKGTDRNLSFSISAGIIIGRRLKDFSAAVKEYFAEDTESNLHKVRIALRRLRYTLEVFYYCLEKKSFTQLYKQIEDLQEISGKVRDFDILQSNIRSFSQQNGNTLQEFLQKIEIEKRDYNEELRLKLMEYSHSRELKNFRNQLKKRR